MPTTNMIVSIGLITREQCILVGKRTEGYYSGYWEFPGGKSDLDENPKETVIRELNEELNIHATDISNIMTIRHQLPLSLLTLHVWQIHTYNNDIIANEQQLLQWAPIDKLHIIKMIPTNKPIISYLQQSLNMNIETV
ncbi:NUDIX domain-containing protein [Candidatus Comchoanobacter bicostacola]|uniref:8-oxo-dGTP diphosphatase n=1 Tax=Candidatus Comchoanobacter bicostacola TaxID=2919598 RepID=A0ABY5DLP0_9GAMM|nr:NUDIX domain-containing protein [Candidatus Comchoanobacter bicostacola]UTC24685.1 NUDIX domain-containing protein [Candidatus Comchoanobacter bicostacola]